MFTSLALIGVAIPYVLLYVYPDHVANLQVPLNELSVELKAEFRSYISYWRFFLKSPYYFFDKEVEEYLKNFYYKTYGVRNLHKSELMEVPMDYDFLSTRIDFVKFLGENENFVRLLNKFPRYHPYFDNLKDSAQRLNDICLKMKAEAERAVELEPEARAKMQAERGSFQKYINLSHLLAFVSTSVVLATVIIDQLYP